MGRSGNDADAGPAALRLQCDDALLTRAAAVVLGIGASALLAAVHAHLMPLPRGLFVAAQLLTLALLVRLIACWLRGKVFGARGLTVLLGALPLAAFVGLAVSMMLSGFAWHDEIYSWNLWAIQHLLREPYDRSYTQAAYPQLYAYWLASVYAAQGGFQSQLLTRFVSAVPMLLLVSVAGAFWPRRNGSTARTLTIAALITLLVLASTLNTLRLGYADPLMAAALVTSVALLLRHAAAPAAWRPLVLSVVCGAIAAYTKQPAILWACGILPVAVMAGVWRWSWPRRDLLIAAAGAVAVGVWLLATFAEMADNQGALRAGLGDRGLLATGLSSVIRYLLRKPHLLFIVAASWHLSRRDPRLHGLWWLGVLPLMMLWFTLGSYEQRHGLHVLWLASLLLLAALGLHAAPPAAPRPIAAKAVRWRPGEPAAAAAGAALIALVFGLGLALGERKDIDLGDGQQLAFVRQMGPQAAAFYNLRLGEQSRIWTTSNYTYGLFYGRLPVGRPAAHAPGEVPTDLVRELQEFGADYAVSSGRYAYGAQSGLLLGLAALCPQALRKTLVSQDGEFIFFAIDQGALRDCPASGT